MKNQSSTSMVITWMRPRDLVLGLVIEYVVTYRAVKVAEIPVYSRTLHTVELDAHSTSIQITELESYTTYNITVTPIARGGKRMKSAFIYAGKFYTATAWKRFIYFCLLTKH